MKCVSLFCVEPKTGVFWNIEDCPIPDGLDPHKIFENIKSNLLNHSFDHGEVTTKAYYDSSNRSVDELSSLGYITLEPRDEQVRRFKNILEDILLWCRQNRVQYPNTIHKVMVETSRTRVIRCGAVCY